MQLEAMILCGGYGTRMREETEIRPKPMVEIGGIPMVSHIMDVYNRRGNVKNFVLCLGYKGDVIRDYFHEYRVRSVDTCVDLGSGDIVELEEHAKSVDWRVTLAETGVDSLTGRRIKIALKYISGNRFLATYGDGLADIDIEALVEQHIKSSKLATVTAVHPSSRFGELKVDGNIVSSFEEKPQVQDGWINGGFFVFEKEAFDHIEQDENVALEDGLLKRLAEIGELAVYHHNGFWQCMDTTREMQLLNKMWAEGNAPWAT